MTNSRDTSPEQQTIQWREDISTREDVRRFIIEKLAEIRLVDADVLEQDAIQNGGDLAMKSDEGTSITGALEGVVGRDIAGPEDINPRLYTSIERLTDLLHESLQKPPKSARKRSQKRT